MSGQHSLSRLIHRVGNLAHRIELSFAQKPSIVIPRASELGAGVELIRRAPLARLRQPQFIEHEVLPQLGLNNEIVQEQSSSLSKYFGQGLGWRIWQYPNQFSKYLVFLSSLAPRISSYAEIGCRFGGTFVLTCEYLTRFNPEFGRALAVDLIEQSELLEHYHQYRDFEYFQGNSAGAEFATLIGNRRYDLALIDGDHSFDGVLKDFDVMRDCRVLVFHDIRSKPCPETTTFWTSLRYFLKNDKRFFEFVDQYCDVDGGPFLGIGVMVSDDENTGQS
jgi:hypothetical protein